MTRASRPVLGPWPQQMVNQILDYDWGSTTSIARLQGRRPHGSPEAELWMGAHPHAPSLLVGPDGARQRLDTLVEQAPTDLLGGQAHDRFGARLPFLLKVLAIERPLSLQVHPGPEQAASAYAADAAGDGEHRYSDPYAKPELLYALEPVDALCGFRSAGKAAQLLGRLRSDRLSFVASPLHTPGAETDQLQRAFRLLVTWPEDDRSGLAADVARETRRLLRGAGPQRGATLDTADLRALTWASRLAALYPKDPLVAAPFLLDLVRLDVGQTLFVPAGTPHAYLYGLGIEVMGSSDNVLRAGLTHKPIATDELLAVVDGRRHPIQGLPPRRVSPHEVLWQPGVAEFQLSRLQLDSAAPVQAYPQLVGPQIVLCTEGSVVVTCGGCSLTLTPGTSAFLGASSPPMTVSGPGEVFRAATGVGPGADGS